MTDQLDNVHLSLSSSESEEKIFCDFTRQEIFSLVAIVQVSAKSNPATGKIGELATLAAKKLHACLPPDSSLSMALYEGWRI